MWTRTLEIYVRTDGFERLVIKIMRMMLIDRGANEADEAGDERLMNMDVMMLLMTKMMSPDGAE